MLIQHQQGEGKGTFFIEEDGAVLAEMTYANRGADRMIIEHTQVDDALQGQNVGYSLVHHAVEYARTHHLKILPVCSFAKSVFDKKPDFADVLDQ